MEHHIPDFLAKNWPSLTDLHKKLGVHVDPERAAKVLENSIDVTPEMNPDSAYHGKSFATIVYGDTDSVDYQSLIKIIDSDGLDKTIPIGEWFEQNDNQHNRKLITQNGTELIKTNDKVLNWTEKNNLHYNKVKYIMRHKVSKPKWKLKTKSGKEITVTSDHSLIVFRDGKEIQVKPYEILKTDKILTITEL